MGNPAQRAEHIKDAIDFFDAIADDSLPAVSFVKPDSFVDGHPASSKLDLFEAMLQNILDKLVSHPALFKDTALFVAFDEGGGYWGSGYIQPLDFLVMARASRLSWFRHTHAAARSSTPITIMYR